MNDGSWVILELPGFTSAASGTEQSSLDALRAASDTSYFKGQDALWVKVVGEPLKTRRGHIMLRARGFVARGDFLRCARLFVFCIWSLA